MRKYYDTPFHPFFTAAVVAALITTQTACGNEYMLHNGGENKEENIARAATKAEVVAALFQAKNVTADMAKAILENTNLSEDDRAEIFNNAKFSQSLRKLLRKEPRESNLYKSVYEHILPKLKKEGQITIENKKPERTPEEEEKIKRRKNKKIGIQALRKAMEKGNEEAISTNVTLYAQRGTKKQKEQVYILLKTAEYSYSTELKHFIETSGLMQWRMEALRNALENDSRENIPDNINLIAKYGDLKNKKEVYKLLKSKRHDFLPFFIKESGLTKEEMKALDKEIPFSFRRMVGNFMFWIRRNK